jgi:hypothetical protein
MPYQLPELYDLLVSFAKKMFPTKASAAQKSKLYQN